MEYTNKIFCGAAGKILKKLPAKSMDMCVTSPPYYMLRDYGVNGQIGLEQTPEKYIKNLVKVFKEVKRVLKDDGTLWINIGDSYNGSGKAINDTNIDNYKQKTNISSHSVKPTKINNIKDKDLIGIPWMLAFALRADGWYLRQDIIWYKRNPMPESVQDRCTKAHEYIFLFSKSKKYYFDYEAIMEKAAYDGRKDTRKKGSHKYSQNVTGLTPQSFTSRETERWTKKDGEYMRNKRSVWDVPTQPFKDAHFAVFPEKLIVDCINAGTSEYGCCSLCGKPYTRISEKELVPTKKAAFNSSINHRDRIADKNDQGTNRKIDGHKSGWAYSVNTVGWKKSCTCNNNDEILPAIVLDPFMGSGTTAVVARKLNRNFVGIDLNPKYIEIANKRIFNELGLFQ